MKYPRSFSSLRKECAHPELLKLVPRKSYARDKAADMGTVFHAAVEAWIKGANPFDVAGGLVGDPYKWFTRLVDSWVPPAGTQSEVAIGLDALGAAHEVEEVEPHCYATKNGVELVTAGRLDLRWREGDTLVVCDLKSGQSYLGDPWSVPQLVAQAVSALALETSAAKWSSVKLGVYYARLGLFDFGAGPRPSEAVGKLFPVVADWALMTNEPRPGPHCLSCWEKKHCAAFAELSEAA